MDGDFFGRRPARANFVLVRYLTDTRLLKKSVISTVEYGDDSILGMGMFLYLWCSPTHRMRGYVDKFMYVILYNK